MNSNNKQNSENIIKSANWHFTSTCNYHCTFCSTQKMQGELRSMDIARDTLVELQRLGIEKINYVGGEPLCNPIIYDLVKESKDMGFIVSIVTNGALLTNKTLDRLAPYTDWIGLSVDSASDTIEYLLGRGRGKHVAHALEIAPLIHERSIKLKINTTVTRLNVHEDMTFIIEQFQPDRWKVFQLMHVPGQNDHCINQLSINEHEFEEFKQRHSAVVLKNGLKPIFEYQELMLDSYMMISPWGNIFMNNQYPYPEFDIKKITQEQLNKIVNRTSYLRRGALYNWNTKNNQ